ncbi:hypothetical protein EI94DRAFT_1165806 [Lactarius quietus]|nr:hypothetical protein EI94DRAFT_1165806 [Lactarius quietus]
MVGFFFTLVVSCIEVRAKCFNSRLQFSPFSFSPHLGIFLSSVLGLHGVLTTPRRDHELPRVKPVPLSLTSDVCPKRTLDEIILKAVLLRGANFFGSGPTWARVLDPKYL